MSMGPDTEISLDALHQAIIDRIAAQFPAVVTVEDYREDRKRIPLPAILIELDELDGAPDDDPGTEQLAARARWVARIIIGFRTANAEREIRKLAAALGAFIHQQRWGQPVEAAQVLSIAPDTFDPELDQYVVWSVEWQQVVHLGASVWVPDGELPETVLYSYVPRVGEPYEPEYTELENLGAGITEPGA